MAKIQSGGQRASKVPDTTTFVEQEESPFRHYVPGERPRADQAFFELLLLRLLNAKGELPNFDEVWPRAVQALAGMNLLRLSTYRPSEVRDAIATVGGEFNNRLNEQVDSIIVWAESFWRIRQIYGSFRQYLRSFDADGFDVLMEDLKPRLTGLSNDFLTAFLSEAGEKVPVVVTERPQRQPTVSQPQIQAERRPQGEPQQRKQVSQEGVRGERRRRQKQRGAARPPKQSSS